MKVVCDVDGVVADFTGKFVEWMNSQQGRHRYSINDITSYELSHCMKSNECRALLRRVAHDPNFVFRIPRYDGAQDFLRQLVMRGHEVHLVTAPWTGPYHTQAREEWVESMLTPKWARDIRFEWMTPEERINAPGDLLIEDRFETARDWAARGRPAILMDRPWNRKYPAIDRVRWAQNYKHALEYLDSTQ